MAVQSVIGTIRMAEINAIGGSMGKYANDWSQRENELIVAEYFAMLEAELSGIPYNKADQNRRLRERIGRSRASIEYKHQNISAVLENFHQPFIDGYKPQRNYQSALESAVLEFLETAPDFLSRFAGSPVVNPKLDPSPEMLLDVDSVVARPPDAVHDVQSQEPTVVPRFVRLDFLRLDAENRDLGRRGEEWVLDFERRRLHDKVRRPDLSVKVEWTSQVRGDGAGYDITSYNPDGTPRLVEVKTTGLGKHFPFYVTANEVAVSQRESNRYHLYRVFQFGKQPRLYMLAGGLQDRCQLEPVQYRARVK